MSVENGSMGRSFVAVAVAIAIDGDVLAEVEEEDDDDDDDGDDEDGFQVLLFTLKGQDGNNLLQPVVKNKIAKRKTHGGLFRMLFVHMMIVIDQ